VTVAASAQNTGQPPAFRADTRLVEVNALVVDKDGRPLEGLTRDDFTVLDDGKPQAIELFDVAGGLAAPRTPGAAAAAPIQPDEPPLPRGEYSNHAVTRVGGVTVIVLDRINTKFEDQKVARDQIVQFLKGVRREDRIALYVLHSGSVEILHDFTRDNASLIAALARFQARTSRSLQAAEMTPIELARGGNPEEDAAFARWLGDSAQQMSAFYIRDQVAQTAAAFATIAARLAGVRGRKNLVWVSSAFRAGSTFRTTRRRFHRRSTTPRARSTAPTSRSTPSTRGS